MQPNGTYTASARIGDNASVTVYFQLCGRLTLPPGDHSACPVQNSTRAVAVHADGTCDVLGRDDTNALELHVDDMAAVDGVMVHMWGLPRVNSTVDCSFQATVLCGNATAPTLLASDWLCRYEVRDARQHPYAAKRLWIHQHCGYPRSDARRCRVAWLNTTVCGAAQLAG
jgi:hypothetical protein